MRAVGRQNVVAAMAGIAALSLAASAEATLIAYDGFSTYVTSPASTTGANNNSLVGQHPVLSGFADAALWTIAEGNTAVTSAVYPRASSTGLTYSTLPTAGGRAEWWRSTTGTYAKNLYRTASTTDTASVQWASFLYNVPTNTAAETSVGLAWTSTNRLAVAVATNGTASFRFGNTTGAVLPAFSTTYSLGTTHLYLLRIESMTTPGLEKHDQVTMWVDPNLATLNPYNEATLGAGATGHGILRDDAGTGAIGTFNELRFTATPSANSTYLDEFRLGTSLYDVVPVPEPVGVAAAALSWALLLRRRR